MKKKLIRLIVLFVLAAILFLLKTKLDGIVVSLFAMILLVLLCEPAIPF